MWYNVHKGVGFSPRPLPYFYLAGLKDVGKNFTTLLAITRLLDFWVHYPTLPYPKLKNHYPSGPGYGIFYNVFIQGIKWALRCKLEMVQCSNWIKYISQASIPYAPLAQLILNKFRLELEIFFSYVSSLSNKIPFKIIGKLKCLSELI